MILLKGEGGLFLYVCIKYLILIEWLINNLRGRLICSFLFFIDM